MAQIGRAILIRRRADGDQLEQAVLHAARGIGGEFEPPGFAIAANQRVEPGLMDRHLTAD